MTSSKALPGFWPSIAALAVAEFVSFVLLGGAPRRDIPGFQGGGPVEPIAYTWLVPCWIVCLLLVVLSYRQRASPAHHEAWVTMTGLALFLLVFGVVFGGAW